VQEERTGCRKNQSSIGPHNGPHKLVQISPVDSLHRCC